MAVKPVIYTKQSLIKKLKEIAAKGWVPNARHGNHGGIGNTLEDLLGIKENNLPIPNAAEWELKTQRLGTNARSACPTFLGFLISSRTVSGCGNNALPCFFSRA